jgi:hypothetical protein
MRKEKKQRKRRAVIPQLPPDPVQQLEDAADLHIDELDIAAQPGAEAAAVLDEAQADLAEPALEEVPTRTQRADTGDLYGVHVIPAEDRELAATEDSTLGENFLEALEETSAENGPAPEHELDVVDDSDECHKTHHSTDRRDRPVADKGAGGTGGL